MMILEIISQTKCFLPKNVQKVQNVKWIWKATLKLPSISVLKNNELDFGAKMMPI